MPSRTGKLADTSATVARLLLALPASPSVLPVRGISKCSRSEVRHLDQAYIAPDLQLQTQMIWQEQTVIQLSGMTHLRHRQVS